MPTGDTITPKLTREDTGLKTVNPPALAPEIWPELPLSGAHPWEAGKRKPSLMGPHRESRWTEALLGSVKPQLRENLRGPTRPVYGQTLPPVALVTERTGETSVPPPSPPMRRSGKAITVPGFGQDLPNPYNHPILQHQWGSCSHLPLHPRKLGAVGEPGRCSPSPCPIFPSILCSQPQAKFCSREGGSLLRSGTGSRNPPKSSSTLPLPPVLTGQSILRWPQKP